MCVCASASSVHWTPNCIHIYINRPPPRTRLPTIRAFGLKMQTKISDSYLADGRWKLRIKNVVVRQTFPACTLRARPIGRQQHINKRSRQMCGGGGGDLCRTRIPSGFTPRVNTIRIEAKRAVVTRGTRFSTWEWGAERRGHVFRHAVVNARGILRRFKATTHLYPPSRLQFHSVLVPCQSWFRIADRRAMKSNRYSLPLCVIFRRRHYDRWRWKKEQIWKYVSSFSIAYNNEITSMILCIRAYAWRSKLLS